MPPGGRGRPQPPPPPRRTTNAYNRSLETSPSPQEHWAHRAPTIRGGQSLRRGRSLTRTGVLALALKHSGRVSDLVRVSETIAAGVPRTTDVAVLELQRESESKHLARTGITGLLAAGFVAVALGALLLPGQRPLSLVALATSLAAYAVASRVEVEIPGFVALPTEAVFVAMWFVMPVRMLPLGGCAGMLLGKLPDVLRNRRPPDRLALTIANCWFSVGPALALCLAGTRGAQW